MARAQRRGDSLTPSWALFRQAALLDVGRQRLGVARDLEAGQHFDIARRATQGGEALAMIAVARRVAGPVFRDGAAGLFLVRDAARHLLLVRAAGIGGIRRLAAFLDIPFRRGVGGRDDGRHGDDEGRSEDDGGEGVRHGRPLNAETNNSPDHVECASEG